MKKLETKKLFNKFLHTKENAEKQGEVETQIIYK